MRQYQIIAAILTLVWIAVLTLQGVRLSGGMLVYTLDDPYIHLAVAETILEGGYGINAGEYASPSSSILFPLLLVPFEAVGLGPWGGLVLGVVGAIIAAWVLAGVAWITLGYDATSTDRAVAWTVLPLLLLAINTFGLPLTGMEHGLHTAASIAVVAWLTLHVREEQAPIWVPLCLAALPLLRFEGLALFVAGLVALLYLRQWRAAAIAFITGALALSIFAYTMARLGLPVLPSSVLVKSSESAALVDGTGDGFLAMLYGLADDMRIGAARTLAIGLAVLILGFGLGRRLTMQTRVALAVVAFALAGHIAFGGYGWFSRYEVYAVAILLVALFALARDLSPTGIAWPARLLGLAIGLAAIAGPYIQSTLATPRAMASIHAQQFQMHRFATEFFPRPVAVNDLGWVAYDNPQLVLDLWGLGSEAARKARAEGPDSNAIARLAEDAGVSFAMIYDVSLGGYVSPKWCRIAELRTPVVTSKSGEVAIYLIDRREEVAMRAALDRFAPTLPPYDTLTIAPCAPLS